MSMATMAVSTPTQHSGAKADVSRADVIRAFKGLNGDFDVGEVEGFVEKCIEICEAYRIPAGDLLNPVEAAMDHSQDPAPAVKHLDRMVKEWVKKAEKDPKNKGMRSAGKPKPPPFTSSTIEGVQSSFEKSYGVSMKAPEMATPVFATPKRARPETPDSRGPASRARVLPQTPGAATPATTLAETPETQKYANRTDKFKVQSSFNEALPAAPGAAHKDAPRVEISTVKDTPLREVDASGRTVNFRYMYEKVEHKFFGLRERLKALTDGIIVNHKLKERAEADGEEFALARVNQVSQERVWCCGRVCAEGDAASLNQSSVMIEGANGKRVKLDLSNVGEFAVFPGQVVVVHGNNTTGECITAREVFTDASLPMPRTPAGQIAAYNETEAYLGGAPLNIIVASGPFTGSGDLSYQPLDDLLAHVRETAPDVVILVGPFVDSRHKLLDPAQAGTPGCFSDPPDSLQVVRQVMREKVCAGLASCPGTACVIVPCTNDLHAKSVFPQPPFDETEVINANDEEGEVNVKVLKLYSNPCTFRINEVVVSVTGQDTIMALSAGEAARTQGGDRIARLASHLIRQRSMFPVFPAPEGSQLAFSRAAELELPMSPDILITPSQLMPFAKRAGEVLCVNPGRLVKGSTPGTFARLSIHPVVRHIRSGVSRKVTAPSPGTKMKLGVDSPAAAPDAGAGQATDSPSGGAASEGELPEVQPQQLSANFESAVAGAEGAAGQEPKADEAVKGDEEMKEAEAAAPAVVEEVKAPQAAAMEFSGEDKSAETLHRVLERTRVDIVRI